MGDKSVASFVGKFKPDYLMISSIWLLVGGIFLMLFWTVHGRAIEPGVPGVYSLFGIRSHPPHNVFFVSSGSPIYIRLFVVFNSFMILVYYRHGRKWSWYVLLLVWLGLIIPPTIGEAISPGIGVGYYKEAGGTRPPWYNEVSLLGVIIPWVVFLPGILLGVPNIIRNGRAQLENGEVGAKPEPRST